MGIVEHVTPEKKQFKLKSRSDTFFPTVTDETEYTVLTNLDGVSQDSIADNQASNQKNDKAASQLKNTSARTSWSSSRGSIRSLSKRGDSAPIVFTSRKGRAKKILFSSRSLTGG
jgi:hypothetical protein